MPTPFQRLINSGTVAVSAQSPATVTKGGITVTATAGQSTVTVQNTTTGELAQCDGMVSLTAAQWAALGLLNGSEFVVDGQSVRVAQLMPDGAGLGGDVHYRRAR